MDTNQNILFQKKCIIQLTTINTRDASWSQIDALCIKMGGSLAMFKTKDDLDLLQHFQTVGYESPFFYIGLRTKTSHFHMYRLANANK